jgi:hypothetical protein
VLTVGLVALLLGITEGSAWGRSSAGVLGLFGLAMAALPRLVNQASPVEHSGSANGVNTLSRVLGGALGSQLGAAVVAGGGGFGAAFWLAAGVAAVGGGLAVFGGPSR